MNPSLVPILRPATISLLPETYKLTRLFCMLRSKWYITYGSYEQWQTPITTTTKTEYFKASVFWIPFIYLHVCLQLFRICYVLKFLLFIYLFIPVYSTATERHSSFLASDLATTDTPRQTGLPIADIDLITCTDNWHIYKKSRKNSQCTNHASYITHPYIG